MSLNSLMIHTCDVQSESITVGDGGGKARAWTDTKTGASCRFQELTPAQQEFLYQQKHIEATHKVFFNEDPGITKATMSEHRLVGATPTGLANRLFEIRGVKNTDELDRLWTIFALESEFKANQ